MLCLTDIQSSYTFFSWHEDITAIPASCPFFFFITTFNSKSLVITHDDSTHLFGTITNIADSMAV